MKSFTRSWKKEKSSIKSSTTAVPAEFDPRSLIGEIEIPIFNFSEFKGMTANKLKEWFISFLPKEGFEIDWNEYLVGELGSRASLLPEGYMDEVINYITSECADYEGVDLVKRLNAHFKEEQSFQKSQVERLQNTLNSMIYYQDVEDADYSELVDQLRQKSELRDQLIKYESQQQYIKNIESQLAQIHLAADSLEEDPEYRRAHAARAEIEAKISELTKELSASNVQLSQLKAEYAQQQITSDICPYTKTKCDKIAASLKDTESKRAELKLKIDSIMTQDAEKVRQLHDLQAKSSQCVVAEDTLKRAYTTHATLCLQIPSEVIAIPTSLTAEQLQLQIDELNDKIAKLKANEQFNQMNNTIKKDKFRSENIVEVLKIWINSTGANGLQTYMMEKPFKMLAYAMSTYLTTMFGSAATASFNLEEKANSFSFGMMRDDAYVEFDLLSSGEKCLFTIAMMMCLIDKSSAGLKLILADDILDHLDSNNADRLFSGLSNNDIQFIMAGVKECKNTEICTKIGE